MLIPDWQAVLKRAWSVRPTAAAGALSGLEVALPLIEPYIAVSPGIFSALAGVIAAGALVMRIVVQRDVGPCR